MSKRLPKFKRGVTSSRLILAMTKHGENVLKKRFLLAAERADYVELTTCINSGVDVNTHLGDGFTAMHLAAERGDLVLALKLTLCNEINLNVVSEHGLTPLLLACNFGRLKFIKFLLHSGANPNIPNFCNQTPLHKSSLLGYVLVALVLLKYDANVNAIDAFGNTPLSFSILERPLLAMSRLLVKYGADINLDTGKSMHLLLETVLACHDQELLDSVEFLLENVTDPNVVEEISRKNALHYAAMNGYEPLVKLLLFHGVDATAQDLGKRTPLDVAKLHKNLVIVDILEEWLIKEH